MKYTLLDIVQTVLSSLDSDEVNSITDTTEAFQVAHIVRRCYNNIASHADLPEHRTTFNLTASSTSTPVVMYKPDTVDVIDWIKYDKQTLTDTNVNFTLLTPLSLSEFLDRMHSQTESDTEISTFNLTVNGSDTFEILYRTDVGPSYYTTFDDGTILFDAIDTEVDSNLQASKTLAYGIVESAFLFSDTFIPNLDDRQFNLLLNEAISLAAVELKQQANPKAEQQVRRGWISLQRTKNNIPVETDFDRLPDYGRN